MPLTITCSACGFRHSTLIDMRKGKNFFGMVSDWQEKTLNCKKCGRVLIVVKPREVAKYVSTG